MHLLEQNQQMDKKTDLGSSLYFSDKAFSLNSQGRPKGPQERKQAIRVQIVNQNLNDAIRQVRSNIRQNPEWNLNVRAVTDQYRPKKDRKLNIINESIQERPGSNFLPQGKREPHLSQSQIVRKPDFQKMKYTERMKKEYEQRMRKMKEKRMQLEVISLERQMRAKLDRKVKENMMLKDKAKIIEQIQEKRQEKMRLLDKQHLIKREERSLLHESNLAKVDMLRRNKKRVRNRELSQSLSKSQQSKMEIKFKDSLVDKQKKERKQMLVARYRMLRSVSQGTMRQQRQQRTHSVKQLRGNQVHKEIV